MKKRIFFSATAFIFAFITLFCPALGCGSLKTYGYSAFNSDATVLADKKITREADEKIKTLLSSLEEEFSLSGENSSVAKLNAAATDETVHISSGTATLLFLAKDGYDFTDGKFDPTVYPLLKLWKLSSDVFDKSAQNFTPPSAEIISETASLCDLNFITLDKENSTAVKSNTDVKIDFGGIAKGYAADKIAEILEQDGVKKGFVNFGGSSIRVFSYDKQLSVVHPRKPSETILSVNSEVIGGACVSTSGDYVKFYTDENGKRYSHIMDKKSGAPSDTGICGATVIIGDDASENIRSACFADMISTALCVMNKDEAISFIKAKLVGATVFCIYDKNGETSVLTNAESDTFTVKDGDYAVIKI